MSGKSAVCFSCFQIVYPSRNPKAGTVMGEGDCDRCGDASEQRLFLNTATPKDTEGPVAIAPNPSPDAVAKAEAVDEATEIIEGDSDDD